MTEESLLIWGFGLIAGALVVLGLELIIPSAGVLGLIALAMAIGSVIAFFNVSMLWGFISLGFVLVMIPASFLFFFKVMPYTPIGRSLFLTDDEAMTQRSNPEQRERESAAAAMIGKTGTAVTDLLPAGRVEIEGERHDAVAVGRMIDRGQSIRVVSAVGLELRVRSVEG